MGRQEEGIDLGGPRREYLWLLMETIARSPMFEGKENCKSLALDSTALREDRFCEGMKTLGVLDAVRTHPDSFKPLFCYEEHLLSADQMDNLFIIQLSPEGSNKRTAEERVVTYWRDYLQDAEEEQGTTKVQKILAFATGASVVPPIGFSPTPSVEFIHNGEDDFASTPLFPIANTCVNCIGLPLHVSYGVFKDKFDLALGNTYGFGRS
ncbi:hypothetical protein KUCAC02_010643 [Chaenocephalus aceratus]|uniref:Uncharacterized protein n=1 Tax=Chaenocephalus aceratus TaxID=36190 RepID=A0ACB9W012_CHAAC|nr:hypothetical protein KUCAC02_010643 [Chaenocephalus aceratus]